MTTKEQFNEANPLTESANEYLESIRDWADKANKVMDRLSHKAHCTECGDPVLGDVDALCRNCV